MANSKKTTTKTSKPKAKKAATKAPVKAPAKKATAKKAPAKKQAAKKAPAKKQASAPKKTKNLAESVKVEIRDKTGLDIDSTIGDVRDAIKTTQFQTTTTSSGEASINISFSPPAALKKLPWFKRIFKKK
jgi:hypothetical protein